MEEIQITEEMVEAGQYSLLGCLANGLLFEDPEWSLMMAFAAMMQMHKHIAVKDPDGNVISQCPTAVEKWGLQ